MLQRRHVHAGLNAMCECSQSLDRVSDVKGMAFAWCDAAVFAKPTPDGLGYDVLGTCTTTLGGTEYTLKTVRLLMPSVHSLWCNPSPLEVQFVHDAASGDRLVLAALFREGDASPDVHAATASLLLERPQIRLIDLLPLGRRFFVHDASDPPRRLNGRELHMISETEMVIAFEQLAKLYTSIASDHQRTRL